MSRFGGDSIGDLYLTVSADTAQAERSVRKLGDTMVTATAGARAFVRQFTGITATAAAAAGAIFAVADAVKAVAKFIDDFDGKGGAERFLAGLTSNDAVSNLAAVQARLLEVQANLERDAARGPFGLYQKALEDELARLRRAEQSIAAQVRAQERRAKVMAGLNGLQEEALRDANAMLTEEERINAEYERRSKIIGSLRRENADEDELQRLEEVFRRRRDLLLKEIEDKRRAEEELRREEEREAERLRREELEAQREAARKAAEEFAKAVKDSLKDINDSLAASLESQYSGLSVSLARAAELLSIIARNTS